MVTDISFVKLWPLGKTEPKQTKTSLNSADCFVSYSLNVIQSLKHKAGDAVLPSVQQSLKVYSKEDNRV